VGKPGAGLIRASRMPLIFFDLFQAISKIASTYDLLAVPSRRMNLATAERTDNIMNETGK